MINETNNKIRKKIKLNSFIIAILLITVLVVKNSLVVKADYMEDWEFRKSYPIESNSYEGWPDGPRIGAGAAILIEAKTGTVLYAKNMHEKNYPASTTKILTTLIGIENCKLDEDVHISREAVNIIEEGSSNVGLDAGEVITVEQCLYAILVGSANEASNAIAEHTSGTIKEFVELMNKRAEELGCMNSHFVTTNGLHSPEHYTTPYDLAQIARVFFNNETLCKMSSTPRYYIPKSETQPDEDLYINTHNQLLFEGGKYNRDYIVGSKTGFTTNSRQTLVTCAEKDGMKLICVVMKEESPYQFQETIKLLDWGFDHFKKIYVAENEKSYSVDEQDFFTEENDVFGGSAKLINIDKNDYVVVPVEAAFKYLDSDMENVEGSNDIAKIQYYYHGQKVGTAKVQTAPQDYSMAFDFSLGPYVNITSVENGEIKSVRSRVFYVNVVAVIIRVIIIAVLFIIIFTLHSLKDTYNFTRRRSSIGSSIVPERKKGFRRRRQKSPFEDL